MSVIFRRINGRIVPIIAKKLGAALEHSGLNTKPIRNQVAKAIVATRKAVRSGGRSTFGINALIDIAQGQNKMMVYRPANALPGSKTYKALGKGGPITMRFSISRKGLPDLVYGVPKVKK